MPVIGTPISVVSTGELLEVLEDRPSDQATVVAFCNVHSVMTARKNQSVARALNDADVVAPDGMPVAWALKAAGFPTREELPDQPSQKLPSATGSQSGGSISSMEARTKLLRSL